MSPQVIHINSKKSVFFDIGVLFGQKCGTLVPVGIDFRSRDGSHYLLNTICKIQGIRHKAFFCLQVVRGWVLFCGFVRASLCLRDLLL